MLKLRFRQLFTERGITNPYNYLQKNGIPRHTARRILTGEHTHIHFRYLELICKALLCTPNDLLEYTPSPQEPLPENHPLNSLKKENIDFNWLQTASSLPLEQLHQLIQQIKEQLNKKSDSAD